MTFRQLCAAASLVATALVALAGVGVWRRTPPARTIRSVAVAWRCATTSKACDPVVEVEHCTTCHEAVHPALLAQHESVGCASCHGGDAAGTSRDAAHDGLVSLGRGADVPAVQARCSLCHEDTEPRRPSPARAAWARWLGQPPPPSAPPQPAYVASALERGRASFRSLRCGACHQAKDTPPNTTSLETLALRSSAAELVTAITHHGALVGYDPHVDEGGAAAVAAYLRKLEPPGPATAMLHRASVPGSSAAEGLVLEKALRCAACHQDLAADARQRTADWLAYYLADPVAANPAATMPSLRLSQREAASLALAIAPVADTTSVPRARADQGETIVTTSHCETCHGTHRGAAPSLVAWGDGHDGPTSLSALESHEGYHLGPDLARNLATYLLSLSEVRVRGDLRVSSDEGARVFAAGQCGGCHVLDDPAVQLSLFGEGLRVRSQWLFDYLQAPEHHPVRPAYHPELAYRELVPADHVTVRMPSYPMDEARLTSLVRFFDERDGASFPYTASSAVSLSGDALTTAIGDLTRKNRGACLSCHTVAQPDVARAREDADKLAPPLDLAHERLRPAWILACIAQPDQWVPPKMPAFVRPVSEVEPLGDLILLLRDRTVLPPAGTEGAVPALGLGNLP